MWKENGVAIATARLSSVHGEYLFFFFFQAEDGIRDLTVTGVQTCALPISAERSGLDSLPALRTPNRFSLRARAHARGAGEQLRANWREVLRLSGTDKDRRSEERRVGKECRSRWSPYH